VEGVSGPNNERSLARPSLKSKLYATKGASLAQRELVNLSENHYEKEAAAMVGVYKVTLRRELLDTGLICRFLVRVYFKLRALLIMRLFGPKVSFP
jgi:hypothetical protein